MITLSNISRDELEQKLERKEPFKLVETLPPQAYRMGHLPNAINLPPDRIDELAPGLLPDKSADIVVYCGGPT